MGGTGRPAATATAGSLPLLATAAGGVVGVLARYALLRAVPRPASGFPWATLATNVSGALALGLVAVVLVRRFPRARRAAAFLTVGVLGSYTTFSTLAVDAVLLAREHRPGPAAAYVAVSVVAGPVAAALGLGVGRAVTRPGREVPGAC